MKKAFCEPGNTSFCPPIAVAKEFALAKGELLIQRSSENGGDRVYRVVDELEKEFSDGSLHPGDLKASVSTIMLGVLEQLAKTLKSDKDASKAMKDLKAFQKKSKKK